MGAAAAYEQTAAGTNSVFRSCGSSCGGDGCETLAQMLLLLALVPPPAVAVTVTVELVRAPVRYGAMQPAKTNPPPREEADGRELSGKNESRFFRRLSCSGANSAGE